MSIEDDLFSEGILPYPTNFPNEDDVMSAINQELFDLGTIESYASGNDAIAQIENFESEVSQSFYESDFGSFNQPSSDFPNNPSKNAGTSERVDGWHSVSYAYGLANSHFRPKLKFMFYIDFMLKPEFSELANENWARNMSFMAKSVDRPRASFEYEDINQYNFKTKVMKGTKTEDVTLTFYDDSSNSLIDFFRFVMSMYQPITRRANTMSSDMSTGNLLMLDGHGMTFSGDSYATNDYSHRAVVNTDNGQIFQVIKVTQTYIVPSEDSAARQISYLYVNPIINSIEMGDLSAEDSSNPCEITIKFSYDAIVIPNTEGLAEPRNPMPNLGQVPSDFSISSGAEASGISNFVDAQIRNTNTSSALTDFVSNALNYTSGGYNASSFIPGLSSSRNLNIWGDNSMLNKTLIREVKKYGMRQLPPQTRQIVSILDNQFSVTNRTNNQQSNRSKPINFLNDTLTPGDKL